ncbi:MAG TPA: response regulator [Nitrospiraceae bacterium]|nr:response regulator [Nitrospiraceae bacterium]
MASSIDKESRIRVLLVDDHALFRQVVRVFLSQHHDIEVVGEAANGLQAVEQADSLLPDVILMDVYMAKMDGIAATRSIKTRHPHMVFIGLSIDAINHRAAAIVAAGAVTVLMKESVVEVLHSAIHSALAAEGNPPTLSPISGTSVFPPC